MVLSVNTISVRITNIITVIKPHIAVLVVLMLTSPSPSLCYLS